MFFGGEGTQKNGTNRYSVPPCRQKWQQKGRTVDGMAMLHAICSMLHAVLLSFTVLITSSAFGLQFPVSSPPSPASCSPISAQSQPNLSPISAPRLLSPVSVFYFCFCFRFRALHSALRTPHPLIYNPPLCADCAGALYFRPFEHGRPNTLVRSRPPGHDCPARRTKT